MSTALPSAPEVGRSPSLARPSAFGGHAGVAQVDITPPIGIHVRNWGAATRQTAEGIHQPLRCMALALAAGSGTSPLVLVSLDLGFWRELADEPYFRAAAIEPAGVGPERVVVTLSHTHAGPSVSLGDARRPGGSHVAAYRRRVHRAVKSVVAEALESTQPCLLEWKTGWCGLARDRDVVVGDRIYCGYNPAADADGTLLVGRLTAADGSPMATIVNYACHPTIMAWETTLISPDWIGAMRDDVERATGAPCLFLQGASGELAPPEQHTSSASAAARAGAEAAAAVVATLAGMRPPGRALALAETVESGAPLARWRDVGYEPSRVLRATRATVSLPLRELPSMTELELEWSSLEPDVRDERLGRAQAVRASLGDGVTAAYGYWVWQLGSAWLIAHPGEAYSWLQRELRRRLGTVVVLNLTNGFSVGYLPPADAYHGLERYQVWQSPFAAGALEQLAEAMVMTAGQRA